MNYIKPPIKDPSECRHQNPIWEHNPNLSDQKSNHNSVTYHQMFSRLKSSKIKDISVETIRDSGAKKSTLPHPKYWKISALICHHHTNPIANLRWGCTGPSHGT
jgi:hypothetical protein